MIFIKHENGKVTYAHYMPFDEKYGMNKTQAELEMEGVLVETIPDLQQIESKTPVMYVNTETKEIYYEYEEMPSTPENEIKNLKQENKELREYIEEHEAALIELMEMMLGGME